MAEDYNDIQNQIKQREQQLANDEEAYNKNRSDLLKIGKEYFKETILSLKQTKENVAVLKKLNTTLKKLEESDKALNKATDEVLKTQKNRIEAGKKEIEALKIKAQDARKGFLNQIKYGGTEDIDWNLDRRINGLNNVLSGNFKYGSLQIAQSFKMGRNLINHPMVMFATAAAKLTVALIDFNNRTDRLANKIAGGSLVSPEAKNRKWEMNYQDTAFMMMYGQNKEDFYKYKIGSFGAQTKKQLSNDPRFTQVWAQGRAALSDLGANPDLMNTLMQQQIAVGRTSASMEKFNYKLIKSLQGLDKLSSEQFIQSYSDLNKTLLANNINGLASAKSLQQFQDALNKGTLSVQNFTQGLTARRGGETSTLAGVGAMLAERGLGGKELQDAYRRGDMIAVAGAVRRGGMQMQRDIEKIAPEISRQMGTSDWREALALQSGTPWGQLTGDLKNLEVQKRLASGGSMVIGVEGKDTNLNGTVEDSQGKLITETQDLKNINKELIKATVDNTGILKNITNYLQIQGLETMKDIEKGDYSKLKNAAINALPGGAVVQFILGNPNQ